MSANTRIQAAPASSKEATEDRARSPGESGGDTSSGAMQAEDGLAVHAPSPVQRRSSTRQRPRDERVAAVIDLEAARQACATSERAFAEQHGLAPSTLRGWRHRAEHDPEANTPVAVCQFFETPDGLRLLHRIVVAALLVIVLMGGGASAWCVCF
jgi:transposase-like protein